jgi:Protein of unknown function (DUF2490)
LRAVPDQPPLQSNVDMRMRPGSGWPYVQPVIPFKLSPNWNMISRTIIPVIHLLIVFILIGAGVTFAQEPTTRQEFWPEIDVYIHIKPKVRLYFLGTTSKSVEDGELFNAQSFEGQYGVHVDYIPNPHIILRTGYRYGTALGDNDDGFREHRILTEQTLKKLLPGDLLLSDSNREDFRFIKGVYSFRYRNRVQIEREFHVFKGYSMTPYVSGAIFYDNRYDVWNRNRYAAGVMTSLRPGPLRKMLLPKHQIILDLYYLHQNDSRSTPNHVDGFGAVLAFYF